MLHDMGTIQTTQQLRQAYRQVTDRVAEAAVRCGRTPSDVVLVAVTKYAGTDRIRALVDMGHRDFGENRVQQLTQRVAQLDEYLARKKLLGSAIEADSVLAGSQGPGKSARGSSSSKRSGESSGMALQAAAGQAVGAALRVPAGLAGEAVGGALGGGLGGGGIGGIGGIGGVGGGGVRWHMIGHLQRNKIKPVIPVVRLVHSVDSLRLAEELHAFGAKTDRTIEVLLQVNASGETTKYGVALPAVSHLAEQIDSMIHLKLRGLMTIAPYSDKAEDSRGTFVRTAELFHELRADGVGGQAFNILSMGMTNDFEIAVEEGANIVRVGRAIFGEPEPGDDTQDSQLRQDEPDDEPLASP